MNSAYDRSYNIVAFLKAWHAAGRPMPDGLLAVCERIQDDNAYQAPEVYHFAYSDICSALSSHIDPYVASGAKGAAEFRDAVIEVSRNDPGLLPKDEFAAFLAARHQL